jgi:hypothetical protein
MEELLFALWIVSGGTVNNGALTQPEIKAYFKTAEDCQRVGVLVDTLTRKQDRMSAGVPYQCIPARYSLPVTKGNK